MKKTALVVLLFFSTTTFPFHLTCAQSNIEFTIDAPASPTDDPDPRNQPSIAVSAVNDQIIVGASKVIVGGASSAGATRVAHYFSSDGGRTWASSLLTLDTPQKTWQRATDPSVASDADGNFYLAALMFDTSSFDTGVYVFKSTDGGRTFVDPEPVVFDIGNPSNPTRAEKCYITIDRSPSSQFKNTIYAVWMSNDRNEQGTNRVRILVSHRRPGEFVFSTPKVLSHSGDMRGPSLATGPQGEFYAVWEGIGFPRVLLFNASTDGGETFLPSEVAPGTDLNIYRFTGSLSLPSPAILINGVQRMNSFPVMDVDRSEGPSRGMIYIAWAEATNRSDADVFMMRLTPPNGMHPQISPPVRVNDDPPGADQFFPWLNVDETDGSIEIAFYDRRDDIGGLLTHTYLARSTDGGSSFVNTRVSASQSDPRIQSNIFGAVIGIGDHIGLDAARGKAHLMWTDTRRGKQEIFYGQIPFTDSGGGNAPANDSCQSPRVINTLPYLDNLDTGLATSSPDDPVLCAGNQGTHSVWYSFTSAVDTVYGVDSFTSDFDTTVSVYTGACGALTQIACDDDSGPGSGSLLAFAARAGQTYLIEVAGKGSGGGLRLRLGAPTITSVEYTLAPNGSNALKIQGAGFAENNTRVTIRVGSDDLDLPTIFYAERQGDGTATTIFATRKKLKKKVKRGRTVIVTVESPLGRNSLSIPFSFTRP
ncbi:MAG: sialidase family protein [Acidobacteriota bacterium]